MDRFQLFCFDSDSCLNWNAVARFKVDFFLGESEISFQFSRPI